MTIPKCLKYRLTDLIWYRSSAQIVWHSEEYITLEIWSVELVFQCSGVLILFTTELDISLSFWFTILPNCATRLKFDLVVMKLQIT